VRFLAAEGVGRAAGRVAASTVVGLGLSFAVGIAMARWLGAADFGSYAVAMSWLAILGTAGVLGVDLLLVRQLPAYAAASEDGLVNGLIAWANRVVLTGSVTIAVLALGVWAASGSSTAAGPVAGRLVVAVLIPVWALLRLQQATLRGLRHPALGLVPESVVAPILVLGFVGLAGVTGAFGASVDRALIGQLFAMAIALAVGVILVRRFAAASGAPTSRRRDHRTWLTTSTRMAAFSTLGMLNGRIGLVILGAVSAPQVVGPYAAAMRGSSFVSLALNVAVLAVAPAIARAYATDDRQSVERLSRQVTRFAVIGGIPLAAGLVLLGRPFLRLFGPGFDVAGEALTILVVGELVNVAAGPVATLLVMTGHERDAVLGLAASTVVTAVLTRILAPAWGIDGAAVAGTAGTILWNALLLWFVRRRLQISPFRGDGVPGPGGSHRA